MRDMNEKDKIVEWLVEEFTEQRLRDLWAPTQSIFARFLKCEGDRETSLEIEGVLEEVKDLMREAIHTHVMNSLGAERTEPAEGL